MKVFWTSLESISSLVREFWRYEFQAKERLVTPIYFSVILIVLFAFTFSEVPRELKASLFVSQSLIAVMFALQIVLSRAFEREAQDRIFDMIRTAPMPMTHYIIAKMIHVSLVSFFVVIVTLALASLMIGSGDQSFFAWQVLVLLLLAVVGLSALGVLLAMITLRSRARQVLFPLLFFPMSCPVLLAAAEGLRGFIDQQDVAAISNWFTILLAFNAIYVTLAILLGSESETHGSTL